MSGRRSTPSKKSARTTPGQNDTDTTDIHGGDNYTYNGALGPEHFRFLSWMQQYDRLYEAVPGFRRLVERGTTRNRYDKEVVENDTHLLDIHFEEKTVKYIIRSESLCVIPIAFQTNPDWALSSDQ